MQMTRWRCVNDKWSVAVQSQCNACSWQHI